MIKDNYDVVVVGAGPSGSIAAKFIAERGLSVLMLEKDREIGSPVRCAEAVNKRGIEEFIESDPRFIRTIIEKFALIAPNGKMVKVPLAETGYVLDRKIFDFELAKMASDYGTTVLTKAYVNSLIIEEGRVCGVNFEFEGEKRSVRCKVVVGADGIESRVGRWAGIKSHLDFRLMESCAQYTVSNINVDEDTLYFYYGSKVAPEGYLWVFPKSGNMANIGLGVSGDINRKKSAKRYLNEFMEKSYPEGAILAQIAGGVPCGVTLETIAVKGLILVGDAAKQANPLTGGGIVSGMIAASIGGKSVAESILEGNDKYIEEYPKLWHERLGKRHVVFDRIKNGIYKISDEKFNKLIESISRIPFEKRSLGNIFKEAFLDQPKLLIDVLKVFF